MAERYGRTGLSKVGIAFILFAIAFFLLAMVRKYPRICVRALCTVTNKGEGTSQPASKDPTSLRSGTCVQ